MKLLALLLPLACPAPIVAPAPAVAVRAASRVVADTGLSMAATWINPPASEEIDSIRVRFIGIGKDTTLSYKAKPFPAAAAWVQPIPAIYAGSFDTWVEITTYRRGKNNPPVKSLVVPIVIADPPPSPVTGITLTVVKTP